MMLIKKKNKKAMSISIVLLVLATLVLTSFSLLTFYLRKDKIQEEIHTTRFLEDIYAKEEQINFYINEIMEKAVQATKESENFEEDFPINFLNELDKYKINNKFIMQELEQVQNQVNENPDIFVIEENKEGEKTVKKVTAEFQIIIEDKVTVEDKELFSAVYTYKKTFEKEIKEI